MDSIFLSLLGIAFLTLFFPWECIKTFKAGSIEFSLNQSQLIGALSGMKLSSIESKQIKDLLKKMAQDVEYMNNSRILWIDDNPHKLLGVRRLFRALWVNITMAISSDHAYEILQTDNDFDLFISDIQRYGTY